MRLRSSLTWLSQGFAIAACLAALLAAASQACATDTSSRSASEIQARWQQLKPVYSEPSYIMAPALSAPFAAGSLTNGILQDGLNSINYARYLAGLPDDVALDSVYDDRAQHGAVLLAVGQFAHSQPQPPSMATDFYTIANGATSSSNIGWGYRNLWDFNVSCLGDEDSGNIDRVGHRRWILNPPLQKTGMGLANTSTDTWVFDWSRVSAVQYDSVKWPCAGPFPVEMFGSSVPWSITLNPALYSWTSGTAGHTVTLRRERDNRTWTFTSADTNKSGEYFNFETSGYGVADCFIFRPDPASIGSYQIGDAFDVTLTGGVTNKADASPATVSYRTQFMSQTAVTPPPPPGDTPTPTVTPTATVPPARPLSCSLTAPKVSGKASRTRPVTLVGTVSPARAVRVRIELRRLVRGQYSAYKMLTAYVASSGAWKLKARLPRGAYRMRATTSAAASYRAGVSAYSRMNVR